MRRGAGGWLLAGVAASGLAATFAVFSMIRAWEDERWQTDFQAKTSVYQALFRSRIDGYFGELKALRRFYEGSDEVDRASFRVFVEPVFEAYSEIQAFEWIPRVKAPLRTMHEEAARRDGFTDYSIKERSAAGTMIVAATRDEYFPVYYVEPLAGNEPAVGYDLGSHPDRLAALEKARDTSQLTATAPIKLVQETELQSGFLVFAPVFRSAFPSKQSSDAKRDELKGFVLGVFRIGASFEAAVSGIEDDGINVRILDEAAAPSQRLLHTHRAGLSPEALGDETHSRQTSGRPGLNHTVEMEVAGRHWTMVFTPTPEYLDVSRGWRASLALAVGLLLTAGVVVILYTTRRRADMVAALVDERTAQLQASESQQRAILDTMVEGLITIDEHGTIGTFNGAAESIFGYTPDEVRRNNVNMLMPEPDCHRHDGYLENYKVTGERRIIGIGREVQGRRKNGSVFPMDLSISETGVPGQRVFTGVVRDVSERKQAEPAWCVTCPSANKRKML